MGGAPILEKGVRRSVEVILGPPPREKFYGIVTAASARLQREHTERWIGKRVRPLESSLDREAYFKARRSIRPISSCRKFQWAGLGWAFVWPKELYRCWQDFPIFSNGNSTWVTEHPFLVVRPRIIEESRPYLRLFPPPVSLLMGADNLPRWI
jgi:hypothetical protein